MPNQLASNSFQAQPGNNKFKTKIRQGLTRRPSSHLRRGIRARRSNVFQQKVSTSSNKKTSVKPQTPANQPAVNNGTITLSENSLITPNFFEHYPNIIRTLSEHSEHSLNILQTTSGPLPHLRTFGQARTTMAMSASSSPSPSPSHSSFGRREFSMLDPKRDGFSFRTFDTAARSTSSRCSNHAACSVASSVTVTRRRERSEHVSFNVGVMQQPRWVCAAGPVACRRCTPRCTRDALCCVCCCRACQKYELIRQ